MLRPRSRVSAAVAGVCFALAGCGPDEPTPENPGVRVVLITLDTLRLDVFAKGEKMRRTLERARRGRVFTQHYAASSTTQPTHASMLTGLQPWEHGVTANGTVFPRRCESVAERLSAAGFRTAAVVASFPLHGKFGFEQGFDVYHNEFGEEGEDLTGQIDVDRDGDLHSRSDRVNERVFEVLDTLGGRKQFLWFHYFDAHAPYGKWENEESNWFPRVLVKRLQNKPEEAAYIMTTSREYYDRDVEYLDVALDALFTRLEAESDRWETHIVVASDHGEAFGEGGALGHGKRLVDAQIHVPLFILSPRVEPGLRSEAVGSVDVAPTLLSLAGVAPDLTGGRDLTRELDPTGRVLGMRRTFEAPYEEFRTDGTTHSLDPFLFYAVVGGRLYVGNRGRLNRGDSVRAVRNEALVAELTSLFGILEDRYGELEPEEIDDPETLEALEALGYTQ